jgi:TatD DNase family protein
LSGGAAPLALAALKIKIGALTPSPNSSLAPLFDAHSHLQDAWLLPHRSAVFADLQHVGLVRTVVNGTCEDDWSEVSSLARASPVVLPSYGLHPWDAGNRSPSWKERLLEWLDADPNAAIGEIGLDRWILDSARDDDPRLTGLSRAPLAEQIEVFRWQLDLAAARNRPASIHCLQAWGTLREQLAARPLPACGFLLHGYGGPAELVEPFVALGAYFSFNGAFLGPRHAAKREVFRHIPPDRLLVETDAPAMSLPPELRTHELPPAPDGSTVNHPANIAKTYAALASLRSTDVVQMAAAVETNFIRLFGAS